MSHYDEYASVYLEPTVLLCPSVLTPFASTYIYLLCGKKSVCTQLYSRVLNVLIKVFFRIKGTELCGAEFICRFNAKFALGINVPVSFSNSQTVGLVINVAQGLSTHVCRETLLNRTTFQLRFDWQ